MTNFNAEGNFKDIELWEDVAENRAASTGMSIKVIGGVLAGGLGLAVGAEVLGGLVAAWAIKSAFDSVKTMGQRLQLVRDCGCNAFVLREDEFRIYAQQFGAETVRKELEFVQEAGLKLSPFAASWLHTNQKALPQETTTTSNAADTPQPSTPQQELPSEQEITTELSEISPQGETLLAQNKETPTRIQENETVHDSSSETEAPDTTENEVTDLSTLTLRERAAVLTEQLLTDGFKVDEVLDSQVIAISGTQRGGKGTLAGILAILSQALDPTLKVKYMTAGRDVYPFRCELHSACRYHNMDIEQADQNVSDALLSYLRQIANDPPYSHSNEMLVVDEAMKLFGLMTDEDRQWSLEFLLCRYAKLGATLILVLHASNLSAVVGSKNTEGLASTFKQSVSFIGCSSTSVKGKGLTRFNIASGEYFKADPNNFATPTKKGHLGKIPEWLKAKTHPENGFPDPVRTLLSVLPELRVDDIGELEKPAHTAPTFIIPDTNTHLEKCLSMTVENADQDNAIPEEENNNFLDCLVGILHAAHSYPISFNAIRTSRKWTYCLGSTTPKRDDLRDGLQTLISEGILQGDEETGYRFT